MNKIIIASNNEGKIKEIIKIFNNKKILTLNQINCNIDIEEDGKTFEENAIKKAKEIFEIVKIPCIADDSGLCIKSLDGYPGVYTKRFLGEGKNDRERNEYLIELLKDKNDRQAIFECNIVYYDETHTYIGKGKIEGKISNEPRGKNGFGFDEIFELENGRTLAEITDEEKNKISARKMALEDLKQKFDN